MTQKKREITFYMTTIISCLVAMTVVVIAALLIYDRIREKADDKEAQEAIANAPVTYTQEEVDAMLAQAVSDAQEQTSRETQERILAELEESLINGPTTVQALRPFYPNDIVVVSNSVFHFVPIKDNLKKHGLLQENIQVLENGEMQYVQDGQVVSHKGIDVSKYQGSIDWEKVAADGVEFAIIRLGYRGYGKEGTIVEDETFKANIAGANAAGVKVGVYFFAQAITEEEALEEARFVLDLIAPYKVDFPVVYDVEKTRESSGRMNQLTQEERTRVTITFLNAIREAGYTPMLYGNMEMLSVLIDVEQLEEYEKWYAYYGSQLYFPYEYSIWQYSEKGVVNGINGDVDLNISFKLWGE
ncbi:MAG: hypothetical protein HDR26_04460 [Lachnospiraceae bacterium]|nr:hypothetical protein [Lachnospiraceae bacterium]